VKAIDVPVRPREKIAVAAPWEAEAAMPQPTAEQLMLDAAQRIESGDVTGAREILGGITGAPEGPVAYALAETYDPNMLAAWGTRGVVADVARAKALYGKALDLGVTRAGLRLDALQ
jgi:hypothetical protein